MKFKIFKKKGYQAYKTKDGNRKTIYSRVAEKKYKYEHIPKGFIIHHIDGNKNNNRSKNLMLLHQKDHYRLHVKKDIKIEEVKKK
ncbi:HNH endonuclease [Candidatus Woesearchaeota archaeon]|nr:HNH endonuclease [Candidatus Woesearchaeota archaeon]